MYRELQPEPKKKKKKKRNKQPKRNKKETLKNHWNVQFMRCIRPCNVDSLQFCLNEMCVLAIQRWQYGGKIPATTLPGLRKIRVTKCSRCKKEDRLNTTAPPTTTFRVYRTMIGAFGIPKSVTHFLAYVLAHLDGQKKAFLHVIWSHVVVDGVFIFGVASFNLFFTWVLRALQQLLCISLHCILGMFAYTIILHFIVHPRLVFDCFGSFLCCFIRNPSVFGNARISYFLGGIPHKKKQQALPPDVVLSLRFH